MKNTLNYITYQSFPADTANSLQTISNLKYFVKNGYEVNLIFPLREKNSNDDLSELQDRYNFTENINLFGSKHNYPFGKLNYFKKIMFHISHYLWSKKITKNFNEDNEFYLTRSDWVFYFLAKKNLNVIFECHQFSKTRNFVFKRVKNLDNAKIIFLNKFIKDKFSLSSNKYLILSNGVDLELFNKHFDEKKINNKVIFVGNLLRFGKQRNLEFVIEAFKNLKNFNLTIVGGPSEVSDKLKNTVKEMNLNNVIIKGRLGREATIDEITSSSYGLLINSDDNLSKLYTSPLKYFEYLAAKLKVIAVNFPSHNLLPEQENIYYFEHKDINSFKNSIFYASQNQFLDIDIEKYSLDNRVKKIIQFFYT